MPRPLLDTPGPAHLCHGDGPLPARHHLVPLVMQQVDETRGLVEADEFGQVGGEGRILGESDAVACGEGTRAQMGWGGWSAGPG